MPTVDLEQVVAAYGDKAARYVDLVEANLAEPGDDRALVERWSAHLPPGRVLDAGCGPGHWSALLHARGFEVEAFDATPAFVEHARRTYADVGYRLGDLRRLDVEPSSCVGVLAWFSTIHLAPREVPGVLAGFADALAPSGRLLLGYFTGPELTPFDHSVVQAWAWPRTFVTDALAAAGLEPVEQHEQPAPRGRVHASVIARKIIDAPAGRAP